MKNALNQLRKTIEERIKEFKIYALMLKNFCNHSEEVFNYKKTNCSTSNTARNLFMDSSRSFEQKSKTYLNPVHNTSCLLEKRKSLLILELPYKIDTCLINKSLVEASRNQPKRQYKTKEEWARTYFPDDGTSEAKQLAYQQDNINYFFDSTWPTIPTVVVNEEGITESSQKVEMTDFVMKEYRDNFLENIANMEQKQSSKKVRLSLARSMIRFCRNEKEKIPPFAYSIPIEILAKYFEYLEKRSLKSKLEQHFKQLIEARLVFYIPLRITELRQLTRKHINIKTKTITFRGISYPIPITFIALAKALFLMDEPIFASTTKSFHKFVSDTAKAAKLRNINPTFIRETREQIYLKEGLFVDKLPRR